MWNEIIKLGIKTFSSFLKKDHNLFILLVLVPCLLILLNTKVAILLGLDPFTIKHLSEIKFVAFIITVLCCVSFIYHWVLYLHDHIKSTNDKQDFPKETYFLAIKSIITKLDKEQLLEVVTLINLEIKKNQQTK